MKKVFVPKDTPVVVTFPMMRMEYIETETTLDFVFEDRWEYRLMGQRNSTSSKYECIAYIVIVDGVSFTFNRDHCSLR